MNEIKDKISDLTKEQIKIEISSARPAEKSNEIYSAEIDGKTWFCERPKYHFSLLDQSLYGESYLLEGKKIFGFNDVMTVYDKLGVWWSREELSSKKMVRYYLDNPLRYFFFMTSHYQDVLKLLDILKEINTSLSNEENDGKNLQKLADCYALFYNYPHSVFWAFDEFVYQFKQLLMKFLDKKTANTYLTQFLTAEITKEVIEKQYGEDLKTESDSRGVLYASGTTPVVFYREPKLFHSFTGENEIIGQLYNGKLSEKEIEDFFAFRMIVPVAVQINEQAQYVESQMLSSHSSYILKRIASKLRVPIEELNKLTYQEIIQALVKK